MSTKETIATDKEKLNEVISQGIEVHNSSGVTLAPGRHSWLYGKAGRSYVVLATDIDAGFDAKIGVYTASEGWLAYNKVIKPFQAEPVQINQLEQYGVYVANMSTDHGSSMPKVTFKLYPL